jgi:site-specific DNA-methyltransferase (adenine-specific)
MFAFDTAVDGEVKKFGEIMTPFTVVDDMMNTLPDDVWSNPNLKWLDPCNGIGTFPSIIVDRLMVGLKDVIPNNCDRYKHIIENMIYVCELQAKNMFLFY